MTCRRFGSAVKTLACRKTPQAFSGIESQSMPPPLAAGRAGCSCRAGLGVVHPSFLQSSERPAACCLPRCWRSCAASRWKAARSGARACCTRCAAHAPSDNQGLHAAVLHRIAAHTAGQDMPGRCHACLADPVWQVLRTRARTCLMVGAAAALPTLSCTAGTVLGQCAGERGAIEESHTMQSSLMPRSAWAAAGAVWRCG